MNETALQSRQALSNDTLQMPQEDFIPLRWSVALWLVLAAGSWAAVFYVISLIF
jgi:hypothetical protein